MKKRQNFQEIRENNEAENGIMGQKGAGGLKRSKNGSF
jgi:hypothetical protein